MKLTPCVTPLTGVDDALTILSWALLGLHPQPFCCCLGHELGLCTRVDHITSEFFINCDVDILRAIFFCIPGCFVISPHSPTNPTVSSPLLVLSLVLPSLFSLAG